MNVKKIELGFPDAETVSVFMDGKHVANMTNIDPTLQGVEDIPVELFNLMRTAPMMLDTLRMIAQADPSTGVRYCNCDDYKPEYKCDNCEIWSVIDNAEGKTDIPGQTVCPAR